MPTLAFDALEPIEKRIRQVQATVSEPADGCHVEGQSIDVVLADYECLD